MTTPSCYTWLCVCVCVCVNTDTSPEPVSNLQPIFTLVLKEDEYEVWNNNCYHVFMAKHVIDIRNTGITEEFLNKKLRSTRRHRPVHSHIILCHCLVWQAPSDQVNMAHIHLNDLQQVFIESSIQLFGCMLLNFNHNYTQLSTTTYAIQFKCMLPYYSRLCDLKYEFKYALHQLCRLVFCFDNGRFKVNQMTSPYITDEVMNITKV